MGSSATPTCHPSSSRAAPGSPPRGGVTGATGHCTPGMDTIPNHWHSDKAGCSSQGWQLAQMPARSLWVPAPRGHLSRDLDKAQQLSHHLQLHKHTATLCLCIPKMGEKHPFLGCPKLAEGPSPWMSPWTKSTHGLEPDSCHSLPQPLITVVYLLFPALSTVAAGQDALSDCPCKIKKG